MSGEQNVECPFCESEETIPIVYGLPGPELLAEAGRGEVALGGCVITFDSPDHKCTDCGAKFLTKGP